MVTREKGRIFMHNKKIKVMQKLLYTGTILSFIILAVAVLPYIIKAIFWVLLQMMYYPAQSLIILIIVICLMFLLERKK